MARNCEELVVSSDVLSLLKTSIPKEAAFLSAPSASGTLCAGASNATDGEAKGSHSSPIEGNCQVTIVEGADENIANAKAVDTRQ